MPDRVNRSTRSAERYWVAIPAAGKGARIGFDLPKQYLSLLGKPIIAHTLERFLELPAIDGIVVAIAADDRYWDSISISNRGKVSTVAGGTERCHSVLAALESLLRRGSSGDWVLVHDAARPCVRAEDIGRLIERCSRHETGGLLALPVGDTMKRADEAQEVVETVSRARLWHALTPQMFRLGALHQALTEALRKGRIVTDEAEAMELMGHTPCLVEGHPDNIKITRSEDLALAESFLRGSRQEALCE
ncbi:MAG: 2-C-methyl-D-erythritol 4-phosphate cytidylyltransferase [Gammaproteobacteria bacterium]